jgi:16S rRNA (cytosine1402-N4)-methyltransferase
MAKSTAKLFLLSSFFTTTRTLTCTCSITTGASRSSNKKRMQKEAKLLVVKEKRRTRSDKALGDDAAHLYADSSAGHIPVMLGEVLDVFSLFSSSSKPLRSFVDCTVGAAGHSSAVSPSQYSLFNLNHYCANA